MFDSGIRFPAYLGPHLHFLFENLCTLYVIIVFLALAINKWQYSKMEIRKEAQHSFKVKRSEKEAEQTRCGDSSQSQGDKEAPFRCLRSSLSILLNEYWVVALTLGLTFPIILFPFRNFNLRLFSSLSSHLS